jgi:hypothetical protein
VPGVPDNLEARCLLLPDSGRLDVVREDVLAIEGEEDGGDAERVGVVYPVIGATRIPGEIGGPAHQQRSQPEPVHELAQRLAPGLEAHGLPPPARRATSAPAAGTNS